MLKKVPKNSLIPFCNCMNNPDTKWNMAYSYTLFSFSLKDEKLFLFISCVFYCMWIINIAFSFLYEKEIECTIHSKSKD